MSVANSYTAAHNMGETRTGHLRERNGGIRPNSREGQRDRARGAEPDYRQRNTTKSLGVAHHYAAPQVPPSGGIHSAEDLAPAVAAPSATDGEPR